MKLFRLRRKPDSEEDDRELVLDTDAQAKDQAEDPTEDEAEASSEPPAPQAAAPVQQEIPPPEAAPPIQDDAPAPEGDVLAQIGTETDREMEAEEKESETESGAPRGDDSLDPDLLDIFRDAKNEVVESTLAAELEEIPIQDLLSDLKGISRRLGVAPQARPEPDVPSTPEPPAEPDTPEDSGPPAEPTTVENPSPNTEPTVLENPRPPAEPTTVEIPRPPTEPIAPEAADLSSEPTPPENRGAAAQPSALATTGLPREPDTPKASRPPAAPATPKNLRPPAASTTLGSLRPPARPSATKASGPVTQPRARAMPECPYEPRLPRSDVQSPIGYGRHIQLGLFIALIAATAVGGALWGVGQLGGSEARLEPPAVAATAAAVVVRQESQPDAAVLAAVQAPSEPDSTAIPQPMSEGQALYSVYAVQRGDTVTNIARAFGISVDCILWNNQDVRDDPHSLVVGQELLIPEVDGIIYQVKPGDTLSEIAASHQIDVESIVAFAPNGLTSPNDNIEGMTLLLPGAVPPSSSSG